MGSIMLDVSAPVWRSAEWIVFLNTSELLHVAMLLDQMLELSASYFGKSLAEEHVGVNVINARHQSLESEFRHIRGQRKLADHFTKLPTPKERQRRHPGSSLPLFCELTLGLYHTQREKRES
jgi:hypothetical protein